MSIDKKLTEVWPVERGVIPWGVCIDMDAQPIGFDRRNGDILRWNKPQFGPLYDQAALEASLAAERERCAIVGGAAADAGLDGAVVAAAIRGE